MLNQALTTMLAKVVLFAGISLSPVQTACLANNVYHEARGESVMGQAAVAYVTINRAQLTGKSLCATVRADKQFSWVNRGYRVDAESPAYAQAVEIAALAQVNFINNPIGAATHYHSGPRPRWAAEARYIGRIDNHHFYEDVDGRYQRVSENSIGTGADAGGVGNHG